MNTLLISMLILLLSGVAAAGSSAEVDAQPDAEMEIRGLNDEEVQAFLNNDAGAMERLWSDDLVVTNPLNKLVMKSEVLAMVKSGFLVITAYERKIEYLHIYGDTAIVAGSEAVVWGGKMPMAGKPEALRFTSIWQRQGGHWSEIARHANIIPQRQ
jgi:ketosteroid isomerase-like protein